MSTMSQAMVVDIPEGCHEGGAPTKYPYAMIIDAGALGKAVKVPTNGTTTKGAMVAMAQGLRRRGYTAHAQAGPDYVIVWVEKRKNGKP